MTAQDYPVTFPYGATDGVYYGPNGSVGPYHRGDDRAMPIGTPVIVNGVEIGKSGTRYGGPHLHIGRFAGGKDTNPNGQGFNLQGPVTVTTVSEDSVNGKYVRLTDAQGVQWVYLHLSQQFVLAGQVLKGGDMGLTYDQVNKICYMATGLQADTADAFKNNVGLELDVVLNNFMAYKETRDKQLRADSFEPDQKRIKELEAQVGQPATELKPGVYQVK